MRIKVITAGNRDSVPFQKRHQWNNHPPCIFCSWIRCRIVVIKDEGLRCMGLTLHVLCLHTVMAYNSKAEVPGS